MVFGNRATQLVNASWPDWQPAGAGEYSIQAEAVLMDLETTEENGL